MALKEIIPEISEALQYFKTHDDFSAHTAYQYFNIIFQRSKFGPKPCDDQVGLGKYISDAGYGRLFPKMYKSLFVYLDASESCPQGYRNLSQMLFTYISLSDVSPDLCKSLGKDGGIQILLEGLKPIKAAYQRGVAVETVGLTTVRILQILHNAIRLTSSNLAIYRLNNAVSILEGFLQVDNLLQVLSLMILSYVVNDSESGILATSEQGVRALLDMFKAAASSRNHYGELGEITFSAFETLDAINHLAINDDIKSIVQEKGAFPCIIRMLQDDFSPEDQLVAVEAIWNLAFIESIRQSDQIQGVVPTLRTLMLSSSNDLQRMCESALWQINGYSNNDSPRTPPPTYQEAISEPDPTRPKQSAQIMLSYQWDSQQRVLQIKERLLHAGYRVWMDLTNLRGDILTAMAEAVEESDVILICMTEKYKNSKSCRAEATYAYKQRKKLIPLMMEEGYEPDGWLGLLQGMDLYYRFHSESQFDSSTVELLKAIGEYTSCGDDLLDGPIRPTQREVEGKANADPKTKEKPARDWSKEDVQVWLRDNDLSELCETFSKFNGKHLRKLRTKCAKDEEKFEEELKRDYKLNGAHCTQFIVALEDAFQD
ncbi:uncharacterized protein [Amphiura filiformis]|uniref:uncharacterized protein n=1 Tax=Amphiura filiformis TaxID=82378 RepID=UPI003B228F05